MSNFYQMIAVRDVELHKSMMLAIGLLRDCQKKGHYVRSQAEQQLLDRGLSLHDTEHFSDEDLRYLWTASTFLPHGTSQNIMDLAAALKNAFPVPEDFTPDRSA